MRIRCHLFGCNDWDRNGGYIPGCYRCGSGIYDSEFRDRGRLDFLRRWRLGLWRWVKRRFFFRRCPACRKKLWPWTRRVGGEFCSADCDESHIPF